MCNVVYALLVERALAADCAEMALAPHVEKSRQSELCQNRAEVDAWLAQPMGRQAAGERALIRELGGAA